jgi:hypothetical protein
MPDHARKCRPGEGRAGPTQKTQLSSAQAISVTTIFTAHSGNVRRGGSNGRSCNVYEGPTVRIANSEVRTVGRQGNRPLPPWTCHRGSSISAQALPTTCMITRRLLRSGSTAARTRSYSCPHGRGGSPAASYPLVLVPSVIGAACRSPRRGPSPHPRPSAGCRSRTGVGGRIRSGAAPLAPRSGRRVVR